MVRPVSVLMVAEKPSLAESIAKLLSENKMTTRRSVACNVHEYEGTFRGGQPAKFKVTAVMGHVFTCDFPPEYNNWHAVEPRALFDAPVTKMEANPKTHVVKHLQVEAKGVDHLVLWLDCDREGENIAFEVIKVAQLHMNRPETGASKRTQIHRARFSAITAVDIQKAMNSLVLPNENEALAVDVRQELDLKIGCAFTRFQTMYFQGKYGNLDSSLVSFGPCQTPTLALCVKRHDDILSFVPRKFWTLSATVSFASEPLRLAHEHGRFWERKQALALKEALGQSGVVAKIINVVAEKKSTQRPQALNTVELLKAASTGLGISPQQTMHIAERLYMQGYISYPRTETTKYPPNFDLTATLRAIEGNSLWTVYVRELLKDGFAHPEGGKDVGDHPPITPMLLANEYDLSGDAWRVYDYICRHFIASLSPNCKYLRTQVTVQIGEELFTCSGKRVLHLGFTSVMHWKQAVDEDSLPAGLEDAKGQHVTVTEMSVKEGETTPPDYLTESDLIEQMEKLGIGTDASMAVHIANICDRRYVRVDGTKRFMVPSNLGIVLIHGYQKIDPDLALPTLRSEMEKRITMIAEGKAKDVEILQDEIRIYTRKFESFISKIERMDELFEATFSPLVSSGKVFSKCGKCRRYMHYIALRPQRLHCRTCNETFSLPQGGNIKLFKELQCPLDSFELVLFSTGSKGKGYSVCPQCYNTPPFPEIEANMGCNMCPNEHCEHALPNKWISPCPEQLCGGMLLLDFTSAPRWKMCCNNCTLVLNFNDSVHQVELEPDVACEDCFTRLLTITFGKKAEKEQLKGACVECDEEVEVLLEKKIARIGGTRRRGRGRGRGRRRGGGGRGGGRGSSGRG